MLRESLLTSRLLIFPLIFLFLCLDWFVTEEFKRLLTTDEETVILPEVKHLQVVGLRLGRVNVFLETLQ